MPCTGSLKRNAPAKDIVRLLGLPRLQHAARLGLDINTVAGSASGNAALGFNFFVPRDAQGKETEMAIAYESTRLLYQKASWMVDSGKVDSIVSSYAKAYGADAAMRVATDAVQIFGGYGYTKEYPVEKLMRDADSGRDLCGARRCLVPLFDGGDGACVFANRHSQLVGHGDLRGSPAQAAA